MHGVRASLLAPLPSPDHPKFYPGPASQPQEWSFLPFPMAEQVWDLLIQVKANMEQEKSCSTHLSSALGKDLAQRHLRARRLPAASVPRSPGFGDTAVLRLSETI